MPDNCKINCIQTIYYVIRINNEIANHSDIFSLMWINTHISPLDVKCILDAALAQELNIKPFVNTLQLFHGCDINLLVH